MTNKKVPNDNEKTKNVQNSEGESLPVPSKKGKWLTITFFLMMLSLIGLNAWVMRSNHISKIQMDTMNIQPLQMSVVINKLIYDFISQQFFMHVKDDSHFNDLFEIKTNSIDLFYVPK